MVHANACLERLDHEFSATGGLLGILPTSEEHDTHELRSARNSLLGQWLVFTQHLVARMHELERSYANALDALSGEAAIPRQYVSSMGTGPDGRSGREIAYPQDRWILVNSGDEVFQFIHHLLDKQEAMGQVKEKIWRNNGVSGAGNWMRQRGGSEYARNLAFVDVQTRYYRLAGQGHNTIFLIPAWEHHPAVEYTRKIEGEQTIVSAVQPKFPVRATEFEKRYNARAKKSSDLEEQNLGLLRRNQQLELQVHTLEADNERERSLGSGLVNALGQDNINVNEKVAVELTGVRAERDHLQELVRGLNLEMDRDGRRRKALEDKNSSLRAEKKLLEDRLKAYNKSGAETVLGSAAPSAQRTGGGFRRSAPRPSRAYAKSTNSQLNPPADEFDPEGML